MKALLLLLLWPHHHHRTVVVPSEPIAPAGIMFNGVMYHFPDSLCPMNDDGLFLFLGPDGTVGMSPASCDAAFTDWSKGPPVKILGRV